MKASATIDAVILRDIESEVIAPGPNGFICPQYDHYCFCNIPALAQYLLGAGGSSPLSDISARAGISPPDTGAVIAFLIDGFGYNQWLEYADKYDFLKRFTANGVVAPITSVFPSTTAASVTSIHSGLTPQEHGLPEWWVYFEEIGRIIVTLPFMSLGGNTQDELLQSGVDPAMLFDGDTLYRALGDEGVRSFAFMHKNIANSSYSSRVLTGSQVVAFHDLRDLATTASLLFVVWWLKVAFTGWFASSKTPTLPSAVTFKTAMLPGRFSKKTFT